MAHHRNLPEGMDRIDFGRMRHRDDMLVGHAFLGAEDARRPDEIALRSADDLQFSHDAPSSGGVLCETFEQQAPAARERVAHADAALAHALDEAMLELDQSAATRRGEAQL